MRIFVKKRLQKGIEKATKRYKKATKWYKLDGIIFLKLGIIYNRFF